MSLAINHISCSPDKTHKLENERSVHQIMRELLTSHKDIHKRFQQFYQIKPLYLSQKGDSVYSPSGIRKKGRKRGTEKHTHTKTQQHIILSPLCQ